MSHPLISTILDTLDADTSGCSDLTPLGPCVLSVLRRALVDLRTLSHADVPDTDNKHDYKGKEKEKDEEKEPHAQTLLRCKTALRTLLTIARAQVRALPFHRVAAPTLRLYTDASLLLSLLDLLRLSRRGGSDACRLRRVKKAVKRVDMAIIVAGALGPGRGEWAQEIIGALQGVLPARKRRRLAGEEGRLEHLSPTPHSPPPPTPQPLPSPPAARSSPLSPAQSPTPLMFAPKPIPTIPPPPPTTTQTTPFILRAYLKDDKHHPRWPALERWQDVNYLAQAGVGRVVPVEVGRSYDEDGWGQRIMGWDEFLGRAGWGGKVGVGEKVGGDGEVGEEGEGREGVDEDGGGDGGEEADAEAGRGLENAERGRKRSAGEAGLDSDSYSSSDSDSGSDSDLASDSESSSDTDKPSSSSAAHASSAPPDPPLYLAQHPLFTQFPFLERDIALPDYVYSDPPAPANAPSYVAPPDVLVNVWIGPGDRVVSPAHTVSTDPYFNCYAQVVGRKRVWLAPPEVGPWMRAYGKGGDGRGDGEEPGPSGTSDQGRDTGDGPSDQVRDSDATNHPDTTAVPALSDPPSLPTLSDPTSPPPGTDDADDTSSALAAEYMTNTSTLPLLRPGTTLDAAFRRRFPDYMAKVYPHALEAVLDPGDLLVFPPGWWHAMRGEGGKCWSVSFWY